MMGDSCGGGNSDNCLLPQGSSQIKHHARRVDFNSHNAPKATQPNEPHPGPTAAVQGGAVNTGLRMVTISSYTGAQRLPVRRPGFGSSLGILLTHMTL